jgi:hypothetical protein
VRYLPGGTTINDLQAQIVDKQSQLDALDQAIRLRPPLLS